MTVSKREMYRQRLALLESWEPFLLQESGLPGPRANLELLDVVIEQGQEEWFNKWVSLSAAEAPSGSADEYLSVCGTAGLGRLVAQGNTDYLAVLKKTASDPRWRVREATAIALQRWGDEDIQGLLAAMNQWADGNLLEQRAVVAALCEPRLLSKGQVCGQVLDILDGITKGIPTVTDRKSDEFRVLRKSLAYGWSVAVAADMDQGKKRMEKWFTEQDKDIRWIMIENLKKNRLLRQDADWVSASLARLKV